MNSRASNISPALFIARLWQRKSLFQLNFTAGTNSLGESLSVIISLLKLEPLRNGIWIDLFQKQLAGLLGVKYVFTFAAGRMALYAILKAMGIGKGDEVIIPGYTCVVVPTAIVLTGAKPVYVDISPKDYNMDVTQIEAKITPRTRAIIAQHTFGSPSNLEVITGLCHRYKLYLVEDCAHVMGDDGQGRMLGTAGDAAFFSTDHTKFISTSVGGIAVTDNPVIGARLKEIYDNTPFLKRSQILRILLQFMVTGLLCHPRIYYIGRAACYLYDKTGLPFFMGDYAEVKMPDSYPYPARLSNIQAKVGIAQLKKLKDNQEHRNLVFRKYRQLFDGVTIRNFSAYPLRFVLEVSNRERWAETLAPRVMVETWFDSPAHGKNSGLSEIFYNTGDCPVAEAVTGRIINLPTHPRVKPRDVDRMAALLTSELRDSIIN